MSEPRRVRATAMVVALLASACYTWVKWEGPATATPRCDPASVLAMLDSAPQPQLGWIARKLGAVTTPWKRRGISGWRQTYCMAEASGALVRDAQRSTDGFWTFDLHLTEIRIDSVSSWPACRFIRIEVEPRTYAETVVRADPPRRGDVLNVRGVVVIDTDRHQFLEIHPDSGLIIVARAMPAGCARIRHQSGHEGDRHRRI